MNPTSAASGSGAEATPLAGCWRSEEADWTVHFSTDGTFCEDFEGHDDFRRGTFSVDGDTVTLSGEDGETDTGTRSGDSIDFPLGVLSRS